ncbi:MAG: UDP-N-acetylglucosamine--N-acetylmuramyl-(pentapeptide) pyrophosphoryl-undecaprenol N-acetylglucosamine transferase [Candidatus Nealsonbacteria bacterium]|nr:UDP-N-acetylglucosamine--N-acetylmuramyl-(pentapeptide) pyrophosphoryl-undecaprenol N-acetylglucosamine transferase [Candidatus Nealsonbacteria bacterium]
MKILFTGGGTAGHIFPIIAVVRELRKIGFKADFFYLGPKDEFGSVFLSQEGIKMKWIMAGKIRRYFAWQSFLQNIVDILFKMPIGFFQSFFYVFLLAPDLIFSKGGYGSISPVIAGQILQVPVLLHESDISPGLANRFLSKFTPKVFISFPINQTEYFSEKKMIFAGNPIRKELLNGNKEKAKELFRLSDEKPLLLILGGSQGAQKINDMILSILSGILTDFELIHQTGEKNIQQVKEEAKVVINKDLEKYYHPIAFLTEVELKHALKACWLVISRAGSGSIFEITACQKPSILIPLPTSAQDHQLKNAYSCEEAGAALVLEEANLTPHFFLEKLKYLFSQPEILQKMSQRAKDFSRPEAGKIIAEYLVKYLRK